MALITKQVKVSNKVEKRIADLLGVDKALFKRVKFNTMFRFRHSYFLFKNGEMVGTLNYFWDVRKPNQIIVLKRFSDGEMLKVRHMNQSGVKDFFGE